MTDASVIGRLKCGKQTKFFNDLMRIDVCLYKNKNWLKRNHEMLLHCLDVITP